MDRRCLNKGRLTREAIRVVEKIGGVETSAVGSIIGVNAVDLAGGGAYTGDAKQEDKRHMLAGSIGREHVPSGGCRHLWSSNVVDALSEDGGRFDAAPTTSPIAT